VGVAKNGSILVRIIIRRRVEAYERDNSLLVIQIQNPVAGMLISATQCTTSRVTTLRLLFKPMNLGPITLLVNYASMLSSTTNS